MEGGGDCQDTEDHMSIHNIKHWIVNWEHVILLDTSASKKKIRAIAKFSDGIRCGESEPIM